MQKFTCRISNESDRTMYMVRDDRDKSTSDFGNNSSGGELVTVTLTEKVAKKNEYMGTL